MERIDFKNLTNRYRIHLAGQQYDYSHLIDKNEGDEGGKIFFCKSSDITYASTCVKSHKNHQNYGDPCTDPETERHITPIDLPARRITI